MRSRGVSWVLSRSFGDRLSRSCYQRGAGEDPRTIRQRMDGFDLAGFSGQPECLGRDFQELCGVAKVEPSFHLVFGAGRPRAEVVIAEWDEAVARPADAVAPLQALAVAAAGIEFGDGALHRVAPALD